MRRAPSTLLVLVAALVVGLTACSGGSSKSSSSSTQAASATTVGGAASSTEAAGGGASTSSSVATTVAVSTTAPASTTTTAPTPPPDACFLLNGAEASALVNASVLGNSSGSGATTVCTYKGKALVTLTITELSSASTAHSQFQQIAKGKSATSPLAGIGSEGIAYPGGGSVRDDRIVVTLTSSPPPVFSALQAALKAIVGRL